MSRFMLILVGIALVGCANPAQDSTTASLEGTFKATYSGGGYDGFRVSGTTFTQYDYDLTATLDDNPIAFEGTIANSPNLSAGSGTVIILVTNGGAWGKTENAYYGIRWKGLKAAAVQESAAYASDLVQPTTLEYAQTVFASDTLYTLYGEYARQ